MVLISNKLLPYYKVFRIKGSYLGFAGEFKYLVSLTYQKLDIDPGLKEEIVVNDPKADPETAEKVKKKNLEKSFRISRYRLRPGHLSSSSLQ